MHTPGGVNQCHVNWAYLSTFFLKLNRLNLINNYAQFYQITLACTWFVTFGFRNQTRNLTNLASLTQPFLLQSTTWNGIETTNEQARRGNCKPKNTWRQNWLIYVFTRVCVPCIRSWILFVCAAAIFTSPRLSLFIQIHHENEVISSVHYENSVIQSNRESTAGDRVSASLVSSEWQLVFHLIK